jgi:hypothetical protein
MLPRHDGNCEGPFTVAAPHISTASGCVATARVYWLMKEHGLSRATHIGCWQRREHTLGGGHAPVKPA